MPQIELRSIERVFTLGDSEVHALQTLDLAVEAGEYIAIMGPSGSGKSTLLNLLGLLDRPNGGTYLLEGRDVTTLTAEEQARVRRERIGFVFQSFHLVPRLTAAENIALPMMLAGIPHVAIARATIMHPAMILADEPTGNLDRASGEDVMGLLEGLNAGGVTLIVVTHDAVLGNRARRRVAMEDGRKVEDR
jgi:putative ABC transport system ATP-binding protein